MGKALKMDCLIKTVLGWKRNADLLLGDFIASVDGHISAVTGTFPQGQRQFYRVTFADGRSIECDGEHLWCVYYRTWKAPRILSTLQVIEKLRRKRYVNRLWIDTVSGDFGCDRDLPLHPWTLGALIGNGCMTRVHGNITFSSRDAWTVKRLRELLPSGCTVKRESKFDYRINGTDNNRTPLLRVALESLRLFGCRAENKHIPERYLLASKESRIELLRGLMDTDGNIENSGALVYSTSSPKLAEDVQRLSRSLGALATIGLRLEPRYSYRGEVRIGQPAYRVYISHPTSAEFVSLPRKKKRVKRTQRQSRLTFSSIVATTVEEAQCISVSHPRHLYVATEDYIVTHNTGLFTNILQNVCIGTGMVAALFSLEMSRNAIERRFMAAEARVDVRRAMSGEYLSQMEREKLERALGDLVESRIFIDDSAFLTPTQLRAKARRLKQREGRLDLLGIDYLQLMTAGQKTGNRQEEIASISRALKACAKELDCPVVALAQLNRSPEQRQDKRPMLADLRESGQIEQDADVVAFIHRDEYYQRDNDEVKGLADIIIAKNRNGATGNVKLAFMAELVRFENLMRG